MIKKNTKSIERKYQTKNGIIRMAFCVLAILVELVIFALLFTKLSEYAKYINIVLHSIGIILTVFIYSKNETSTMKMPWLILLLLAPVLGVFLYLLIGLDGGTRKMRKRYEQVDEKLFSILPENQEVLEKLTREVPKAGNIASYISRNAKYPCYRNTDVTYFENAADGLEAQIEAISQAKKFVFMEYFAIQNRESWGRIQDVLCKKVKEGVEVRVFYDDLGSIGFVNLDFAKQLQSYGIKCRVFNPFVMGLNLFLNNRDHRKVTIVDGKVGFTGGYNLADEYFNITHPYGLWKDAGIRLEGDAVKSLTAIFLEMWNAAKDNDQDDSSFDPYIFDFDYKANTIGETFVQPYGDVPIDSENVGEEVYISMVNKAEKYCWFMTPYLILTDEMSHALSLAAKRGVDVRIVTPGIPDKKMVYSVTRSFYPTLVKNGVRIYEWTPGFSHAKLSVADDIMATCGTINMDYRSLYHHFECGCFMTGSKIAMDIKTDFIKTMSQSREVTEKYKTGLGKTMKIGQLLLRIFAQLL